MVSQGRPDIFEEFGNSLLTIRGECDYDKMTIKIAGHIQIQIRSNKDTKMICNTCLLTDFVEYWDPKTFHNMSVT